MQYIIAWLFFCTDINIIMSSFTNALIVKKEEKRIWTVMEEFSYDVGTLGSGETIRAPKGFNTDLASVPRILWSIFPTDSDYAQAAVLHDWLCFNKGLVERLYDSKQVCKIFLESMLVLKTPKVTAYPMYLGVRLFGPHFKY